MTIRQLVLQKVTVKDWKATLDPGSTFHFAVNYFISTLRFICDPNFHSMRNLKISQGRYFFVFKKQTLNDTVKTPRTFLSYHVASGLSLTQFSSYFHQASKTSEFDATIRRAWNGRCLDTLLFDIMFWGERTKTLLQLLLPSNV